MTAAQPKPVLVSHPIQMLAWAYGIGRAAEPAAQASAAE